MTVIIVRDEADSGKRAEITFRGDQEQAYVEAAITATALYTHTKEIDPILGRAYRRVLLELALFPKRALRELESG
ncbi:MAG: hypothetical protein LUJ09_04160 [Firmicutes bacterium]|nr:hypothetical protein [Bacillota bacterium]